LGGVETKKKKKKKICVLRNAEYRHPNTHRFCSFHPLSMLLANLHLWLQCSFVRILPTGHCSSIFCFGSSCVNWTFLLQFYFMELLIFYNCKSYPKHGLPDCVTHLWLHVHNYSISYVGYVGDITRNLISYKHVHNLKSLSRYTVIYLVNSVSCS